MFEYYIKSHQIFNKITIRIYFQKFGLQNLIIATKVSALSPILSTKFSMSYDLI